MNESKQLQIVYIALCLLAVTMFTAFSVAAGFHILMFVAGLPILFTKIKNKDLSFSKSSWSLIALIVFSMLSVFINGAPVKNILKLKYFIVAIISIPAFELLLEKYMDQKRVERLFYLFLIAATIATISGLIGLWSGFNPLRFKQACHIERNCGMYGMYMSYGYGMGYFLIPSIGLALFTLLRKSSLNNKIVLGSTIINFIGFYLSYARGALVGFLCGVLTSLFSFNKKLFLSLILFSILVASLSYKFSSTFQKMINERGSSNIQRLSLYLGAIEAFKENPWFGVGYREYEGQSVAIKKRHNILDGLESDFAGSAHNNFLEHLASTGILGFLSIVLFHGFWLWEMFKRQDWIAKWTMGFVIALIVSGQVEYTLGDGETLFFIMLMYSWSQVKSKKIYEIL